MRPSTRRSGSRLRSPETPADSSVGFAVKMFLLCRNDYGRVPRDKRGIDPCVLWATHGEGMPNALAVSALRDIARLVPELAPLVAPPFAEEMA